LGRLFRSVFVARSGYTLVEFDYSQAEPRLFCHYSKEPVLIEGYNRTPPIDMHSITANYMHITRTMAKGLNLGLQYTMGVTKLAKSLGLEEDTARDMYYRWKDTFPNVSKFTKLAGRIAEERGYVKTILNRRARFPDPRWAYRAANRIIQGGSADILKFKMVEVDSYLAKEELEDDVRMLLNIHDAILFEIRDEILEETIAKIKEIMEDVNGPPFNLSVPFVAEYKTGKDWKEATYD
jgi:DNA polymerase-1